MSGVSASSSSDLPYMTVLACNTSTGSGGDGTPVLPPGAVLLTTAGQCPQGWGPINDTVGVCGLPIISHV